MSWNPTSAGNPRLRSKRGREAPDVRRRSSRGDDSRCPLSTPRRDATERGRGRRGRTCARTTP
eukprot:31502-Pelagococcus_subviridis.AAC.9